MIGISMLTLSPGHMGGSETYARALTTALKRVGTADYLVAVPDAAEDAASGLPSVRADVNGRARVRVYASALRRGDLLSSAEVVHYPFTVPVPRVRVPQVITLHDVLHRDHPALVSRVSRAFRMVAYDHAARGSDCVIVPSAFVRDHAVSRLGLKAERVRVIPHGVDHELFRPGQEEREDFVLYPARYWPHKNHTRLFDAFAEARRHRPNLRLVLTGDDTPLASLPGVESRGRVSLGELARLYRTAALTVFPSLYEGFGSPVLEAMASGCPVAAADAGALPEVTGGAAELFDPRNSLDIAAAMLRAMDAAPDLRSRGLERASLFTWEASARAHERAYREFLR